MLSVVEGLLPEPWNGKLLTLLFRLAEWHALAKLRMHTDHTLDCLHRATVSIAQELRSFRDWTRGFNPVELPREVAARQRRQSRKKVPTKKPCGPAGPSLQPTPLNEPTPSVLAPAKPKANGPPSPSKPLPSEPAPAKPKVKLFNLFTYKLHALGDYVRTIRLYGTTDSYSTQIVSSRVYPAGVYLISLLHRESLHIV